MIVKSILIADDDADCRFLIEMALRDSGFTGKLHVVEDGLELMEFLYQKGKYSSSEIPDLIILDLNMPRKNGRETLLEIKADPDLKSIPLVIFTFSDSVECLQLSRDFRCTYLQKPDNYGGWVKAMGIALTTERPKTDTSYPSPH